MKKQIRLYLVFAIVLPTFIFSCAGSKQSKVDPYIGDWEYVSVTENGNLDVLMTIGKADNNYTCTLSSDIGTADIQDLKIDEGHLTGWFTLEGYQLSVKGDFEGAKFTGVTFIDNYEFPMNATKRTE